MMVIYKWMWIILLVYFLNQSSLQQSFDLTNLESTLGYRDYSNSLMHTVAFCRCTSRKQCSNTALIRINTTEICNFKELIVCCEETVQISSSPVINPMSLNPIIKNPLARVHHQCGYRIVDSKNMPFNIQQYDNYNPFPWMVTLTVDINSEIIPTSRDLPIRCGGSIIHSRVVLTAAHCINDFQTLSSITVEAGKWHSNFDQNTRQRRKVSQIILHPKYNSETLWFDLALLILDRSFDININVGITCLGDLKTLGQKLSSNQCVLSGWGQVIPANLTNLESVKEILVEVEGNQQQCLNDLKRVVGGSGSNLPFLCGYINQSDKFCNNDDGGPLSCYYNQSNYIQFGVATWSYDCGKFPDVPALFTSVGDNLDWIQSEMLQNNLKLESII